MNETTKQSIQRECYNCKNKFEKARYGRSRAVEAILLLTTWWLLWIPLWLYYGFTPRWICPVCGAKQMNIK